MPMMRMAIRCTSYYWLQKHGQTKRKALSSAGCWGLGGSVIQGMRGSWQGIPVAKGYCIDHLWKDIVGTRLSEATVGFYPRIYLSATGMLHANYNCWICWDHLSQAYTRKVRSLQSPVLERAPYGGSLRGGAGEGEGVESLWAGRWWK